jgi:hypothetical protein
MVGLSLAGKPKRRHGRKRSPKPRPAIFAVELPSAARRACLASLKSGGSLSREFSTVRADSHGYVLDHRPDAADVVGVGMGYQPITAREADAGQQSS